MTTGFSGPLPPARFNMAEYCLAPAARMTPGKTGLVVLDGPVGNAQTETWCYAELDAAVRRIAAALRADGLAAGDRLFIRLGNTSDYALLFFGALAAGIVALPASSMLTDREAELLALDAGVAAVAAEPDQTALSGLENLRIYSPQTIKRMHGSDSATAPAGIIAYYADTAADDPAFLIYTSGTTGRPKGVLHAHRSAWGRRPMYRDWYGITSDDRVLHAGAFNWTYTLGTGLTDPWANGATAIVNTRPRNPDCWPALIRETGATIFAAVPGLYRQILKYAPSGPIDTGALRHGLTAGETLPASVATEWFERTGTPLCEALGMSELSTYISASPDHPARPGTIGRVQSGRRVAILPTEGETDTMPEGGTDTLPVGEIGLLAVHRSDPALMLGYWNRPDEAAKVFRGDWFYGGDLASIDDDGFVTHHGRADDLMNAFGYRVSPMEVEQVLAACPAVNEIAVTEIRIRDGVSIVAAFIVLHDDTDALADIKTCADANLADYKRPRDYFFLDSLPRTANGKVRRSDLQAIYEGLKETA